MSEKRRKREAEAKPKRLALIKESGECENCGHSENDPDYSLPLELSQLCVHEICCGPDRQKALDKRYATLVLCWSCNGAFTDRQLHEEAWQLALLASKRPKDFDLVSYLELTSPRAPFRITLKEVMKFLPSELLTVSEVAELCRVHRTTVNVWVSNGLRTCDVSRTEGSRRLLRIRYVDLVKFLYRQKRKERNENE